MKQLDKIMQISPDDRSSMKVDMNGYSVILRFSSTFSLDIYNKIISLLLANFTMDKSLMVCNNTPGQEPNCTLKLKISIQKSPLDEKKVRMLYDRSKQSCLLPLPCFHG